MVMNCDEKASEEYRTIDFSRFDKGDFIKTVNGVEWIHVSQSPIFITIYESSASEVTLTTLVSSPVAEVRENLVSDRSTFSKPQGRECSLPYDILKNSVEAYKNMGAGI